MARVSTISLMSLIVLVLSGCQTCESYVNGQSDIVELDWKSQIHLNKTTEKEIVDLLGEPAGYYHHNPNNGEKFLFYHATSTLSTTQHLPFIPKAQFASQSKASVTRVWFFISKGVVTEQLESCKNPDLTKFIRSSSSEFPYCDKVKREMEESENSKGVLGIQKYKSDLGIEK